MIYGVDIAGSYQAGISIPKLRAEGNRFVTCKATEGTSYSAPLFDTWIEEIKANGMIPGAYHFLRKGDGAAQAQFFYSRLTPHGGPDGMLIQLDCESDASYQDIVDWVNEWNRLSGNYPFAFYTGDWWLGARGWNLAALTPYLWAAPDRGYTGKYTGDTSPDWNAGYGGYSTLTIEQYTSRGTAGGIAGNVDIDVIRDPNALNALMTREADLTPEQYQALMTLLTDIYAWARAAVTGRDSKGNVFADPLDGTPVKGVREFNVIEEKLDALAKPAPQPVAVDAAAVAAALIANPDFVTTIVKAHLDEEARRLAS